MLVPDRRVLYGLPRDTAGQRANGYQRRNQYGDMGYLDVELKDLYFAINASCLMRLIFDTLTTSKRKTGVYYTPYVT